MKIVNQARFLEGVGTLIFGLRAVSPIRRSLARESKKISELVE